MSVIDRAAKTPAVLMQPTGEIADGKPVFRDVPCMVFETGADEQAYDGFGNVKSQRSFYCATLSRKPVLPGRLYMDGRTYELARVREYRDINGVAKGYRLEVFV